MQSLRPEQAKKVIEKYAAIFTSGENGHLNVADIRTTPSTKNTAKLIVQVITKDNVQEDLDNFCLMHDIKYDISDCLKL